MELALGYGVIINVSILKMIRRYNQFNYVVHAEWEYIFQAVQDFLRQVTHSLQSMKNINTFLISEVARLGSEVDVQSISNRHNEI